MPRVKIKHPNPDPSTKLNLLRTLSENLIYATRIIPVNDGYIVLAGTDDEIDKIFNNTILNTLKGRNFTPILPPELRA